MAKKSKKEEKGLPEGFTLRSDGRIMRRFTVEGKRYTVYGNTVKECKKKEDEKLKEIYSGEIVSNKVLTTGEYLNEWIETRTRFVTSATIRTYKKLIKRMIGQKIGKAGQKFGEIKLAKLETKHIRALQDSLLNDGLKTRTVNDSLSLLKKALTSAVNERTITWNPAAPIERLKRTEEQARDNIHRALTREEVQTFMKFAEGGKLEVDGEMKDIDKSWYCNFYQFLLYSGLRIGEAAALAPGDVKGDINVYKTVVRSEIGYEIEQHTKTAAGTRRVPMYPKAREAVERQKRVNEITDSGINISKPVFRQPKGGLIRSDRVSDDIKRICDLAKIERFSAHAFRATFISRCVASGMPVKDLMEICGHKDVEMTLGLYAHAEEKSKTEKLLAVNFD